MLRRTFIESPNSSSRPYGINDVVGVIIHHTASQGWTGRAIAEFFARPSAQVSAHFVIGERGDIYQCVPLARAAWHAGHARYDFNKDGSIGANEHAVNSRTVGIELCNRGDGRDDYPDAQVKAAAKVIRYCDQKCPHLRLRNVTDHEAVSTSGKIDVTANFPAAKLFWWILHPYRRVPKDGAYNHLPRWAQKQVDEIKR
jgi:N-acetylmuramoyl-L-alanine amidase